MNQSIRIKDLSEGRITVNVPNWVRWMAVDSNGSLWFYEHKPVIHKLCEAWAEKANRTMTQSRFAGVIRPPKDYKHELYTWR